MIILQKSRIPTSKDPYAMDPKCVMHRRTLVMSGNLPVIDLVILKYHKQTVLEIINWDKAISKALFQKSPKMKYPISHFELVVHSISAIGI